MLIWAAITAYAAVGLWAAIAMWFGLKKQIAASVEESDFLTKEIQQRLKDLAANPAEETEEQQEEDLNLSNENWELTLEQIARIESGEHDFDGEKVLRFLEFHCTNLRSKISLEALRVLGIVFMSSSSSSCAHCTREDWLRIINMLLLKTANDKKFIAEAAKLAIARAEFAGKFQVLLECALKQCKNSKILLEAVRFAAQSSALEWDQDTIHLVWDVEAACSKNAQARALAHELIIAQAQTNDLLAKDKRFEAIARRQEEDDSGSKQQQRKPWQKQ